MSWNLSAVQSSKSSCTTMPIPTARPAQPVYKFTVAPKDEKGETKYVRIQAIRPEFISEESEKADEASSALTREIMKAQAQRLLERTAAILRTAAAKDATSLAAVLGTRPAALETLALNKLGQMGMPEVLRRGFAKDRKTADAAAQAEAKQAILAWAAKHDQDVPATRPIDVDQWQAVTALCGFWHTEIAYGSGDEASAKEFVKILVGLSDLVPEDRTRRLVAGILRSLFDPDDVGREVHMGHDHALPLTGPETEAAAGAMCDWVVTNLPYFYFHPVERHLKIDAQARLEGQPTSDYRKEHPWRKDEGPNKIDPKKKPVM